jgi:hypothetical protein
MSDTEALILKICVNNYVKKFIYSRLQPQKCSAMIAPIHDVRLLIFLRSANTLLCVKF